MNSIKIVEDGLHVKNIESFLSDDIGLASTGELIATAKNIFLNAPHAESKEGKVLGLLYGLVQSGKTNIINTTIALAADNGYKLFIVLTDNNNDLQQQTLIRCQESLTGLYVDHISSILHEPVEYIKATLADEGVVLICKKHTTDLSKLVDFMEQYTVDQIPTFIIDDEADAVGLNTNQRLEDRPPSAINQYLRKLISLTKVNLFLQVTATPQAIILQDDFLSPSFFEIAGVGNGYVGIDTLFLENKSTVLRELKNDEIALFKENEMDEVININVPKGLTQALCSFFIAATLKWIRDQSNNSHKQNNSYTFLCHISPIQKVHDKIKYFIDRFKTDLKITLKGNLNNSIMKTLQLEYQDLLKSLSNNHKQIFNYNFAHIIDLLNRNLVSSSVRIMNSSTDHEVKTNHKYNILIGGNKFSRGITIPNLLTTYYGRYSASPQVDTLIQHARMCGYRSSDLDITRIFIPSDLAEYFEVVSIHDKTQREIIKKHGIKNTLYLDYNKIKPTRPNVIPKAVGAYQAGSIYFPKVPEHRQGIIQPITKEIDEIMSRYFSEQKKIYDIPLSKMQLLINKIPVLTNGGWNKKVISQYIDYMIGKNNENSTEGQLYYSLDNDIGYNDSREGIGAVLSEEANQFIKNEGDPKKPLLILYRIIGSKKKQWDGARFWIPLFRFPTEGEHIIFNLDNY